MDSAVPLRSSLLLVLQLFVLVPAIAAGEMSTDYVSKLVRRWAPLVWLAPGERFFPSSVTEFLHHVTPWHSRGQRHNNSAMPQGSASESWFLVTNSSIDELIGNKASFIYGQDPSLVRVPVYALITPCDVKSSSFYVTYWMFYPYSQGKAVCTLDMGILGAWPMPLVNGRCFGFPREFGGHIGDWEHVSMSFQGNSSRPDAIYVSTHNAGGLYRKSRDGHQYMLELQEVRRGSALQVPSFPVSLRLTTGEQRPELFAALGSHGLWTAPGVHRYARIPRLYDHSGYGIPWRTWTEVHLLYQDSSGPYWMQYRGRWGNPRSRCHPLANTICEIFDGPTGIPMKKHHFQCANTS